MWTRAVGITAGTLFWHAANAGWKEHGRPYKRSALHGLRRLGPLGLPYLEQAVKQIETKAFYLHFCCLREANSRSVTFSSSGLNPS